MLLDPSARHDVRTLEESSQERPSPSITGAKRLLALRQLKPTVSKARILAELLDETDLEAIEDQNGRFAGIG